MRRFARADRLRAVGVGIVVGASIGASAGGLHAAFAGGPRPAAQTSALSNAVREVSDRVRYSEVTLAEAHKRLPHAYVVSLAAMSYVVGHVSAPQYGYLHEIAHRALPKDAEDSLETQAGICGNAQMAMIAILNRLHVEARAVSVSYPTPHAPRNGHATVEVRYGGTWHWFDPTWGTIYVRPKAPQWNVLSLVDVLNLSPGRRRAARIGDDARFWARIVTAAGHSAGVETGMLFLERPHLRVEIADKTVYRR
jgi:hypothetical protein